MFSRTCEYAIRSLIYLARTSSFDYKISVKEIAREIDAPEYFIGKIMQNLVKNGFVYSVKGPSGGFYLEEVLLKNSLADIVLAIDGKKIFYACGLGLKECNSNNPCPIHFKFEPVRKELFSLLDSTNLESFLKADSNAPYFLKSMIK